MTALGMVALIGALPTAAYAHAELRTTDPAADAILHEPPPEVVMTFDGELDAGGSEFVVTDADGVVLGGGGVDLEVAERDEMRGAVSITSDGVYTVEWNVTSADGHAEAGTFEFSVTSDGQRPPDTAARAVVAWWPATVVAGLTLLLAAVALLAKTARIRA